MPTAHNLPEAPAGDPELPAELERLASGLASGPGIEPICGANLTAYDAAYVLDCPLDTGDARSWLRASTQRSTRDTDPLAPGG